MDKKPPASIPIVPRAEAGERLELAYRRVAGPTAEPSRILGVHSLHPQALEDHHRLYRTVMHGESPLSRVERELLATVVSRLNQCHY